VPRLPVFLAIISGFPYLIPINFRYHRGVPLFGGRHVLLRQEVRTTAVPANR
jgi:hypothetical protein